MVVIIIPTDDIYWVLSMSHCIKRFTTEHNYWFSSFGSHLCLFSQEIKRVSSWSLLLYHVNTSLLDPQGWNPVAVPWKSPVSVEWDSQDGFPAYGGAAIIHWQGLYWRHPSLSNLFISLTFQSFCFLILLFFSEVKETLYGGREHRGPFWGYGIDKSASIYRQHDDELRFGGFFFWYFLLYPHPWVFSFSHLIWLTSTA